MCLKFVYVQPSKILLMNWSSRLNENAIGQCSVSTDGADYPINENSLYLTD